MIYKIEVTQADIDEGSSGEPESCPIALAAQRTMNKPVSVYRKTMGTGRLRWPLPKAAIEFVDRYDAGAYVEPFSFEVELGWLN